MLGKTYDSQVCSIARSLEVIGERWSLLIVRDALFGGATRYSDFQRNLGIATNILKARLDGFVEAGIMRRHKYSEQPELHEYLLTDKGRALAPALVALTEWGDRWATDGEPPILYTHSVCGAGVTEQTVCAHCGRVEDPAEIRAVVGPGMPPERTPPKA
ncbi:winged helix-turn-helix transcriptional regulator [Nonomuraea muscovyensis]|uniref:DNA-binding HxlR family transcriptional regulator n=1 Tax=Nonomuraea muscovyensis TaxID=1124761 RepID=A0A7X0EVX6_9ACTN|nr:helix-turn-helix domain-containing protein [Nonomuraea muscovyensis]MBB6343699.1 DNA-binding HxlR family transcriptional regulator [Nonomuraea muscovyensis]MDF2709025.1 transcriptional regulator, HxlR family [Nonomuraea muscovyensis]